MNHKLSPAIALSSFAAALLIGIPAIGSGSAIAQTPSEPSSTTDLETNAPTLKPTLEPTLEPTVEAAPAPTALTEELINTVESDPEAAIEQATVGIENNPNVAELYAIRAVAYLNLDSASEAIPDLEQARILFAEQGRLEEVQAVSKLIDMFSSSESDSDMPASIDD